jgi:hypothetical protein
MAKLKNTIAARIALIFLLFSSGARSLIAQLSQAAVPPVPSNSQGSINGVRFSNESAPLVASKIAVVAGKSMTNSMHRMGGDTSKGAAGKNQTKPFCLATTDDCTDCDFCGSCGGGCGGGTPTPTPTPPPPTYVPTPTPTVCVPTPTP